METIGVYKAKTHLSKLLERVKKGERIIISKHGMPVAVLQPVESSGNVDVASVIEEIHRIREINSLSGLSIREMIEEGRR
jgi:prevent-host-death family protein